MHATNPHGSEVMNCALAGTNVRSTLVGPCVGTFVGKLRMDWELCDLELRGHRYPEFGIKNKTLTKVFPRRLNIYKHEKYGGCARYECRIQRFQRGELRCQPFPILDRQLPYEWVT